MNRRTKEIIAMVCLCIVCCAVFSFSQAQKRNYAVIGIKNAEGVSAGETEIIADRLRIELFNTGAASMMERDQMQSILSEQGFQQSGACTDEACMVEIGQLLGVERLVSGSIGKLGSMFLLNFRTIDVQTAKIIRVVSQDITGGIEDVVKLLPKIAKQLVSEDKIAQSKDIQPVEEPKKEEPAVETKTETQAEPVTPPAAVDEPDRVPEVSDNSDKNKNRGGIRINFNLNPGDMLERYYWDREQSKFFEAKGWADKKKYNSYKQLPGVSDVFYNNSLLRLNIYFQIKIWKCFTIDIGPGLMMWNNKKGYTYEYLDTLNSTWVTSDADWQLRFTAPNVSTGLGFNWRLYPLKINAGFLVDVNFNVVTFKETINYDDFMTEDYRHTSTDFVVNTSYGPRVGLEIMGGPHFGFNLDFLMRFYTITTEVDFVETYNQRWKFKLPFVGFGGGVNFYF